ncbi:MAG TPA: GtrA family protein [Micromonosporaceae bacterium]|nr:GtrA family protein [Micromonosporaceae bacterium]
MHLLRVLPDRHRKLIRELVSFSFAGMVNTAFGFLLFNLLFSMGSLTANAISTAGGTATSFVLNRHITYRHRPRRSLRHELPLFAAVNLIGLGIQQAVMAMAKVIFDLQSTDRLEFNLARVVSVIVGTVFLLLSYRSVVFRKARAADLADDVAADLAERAATKPAAPAAPAAPDIDEFNELTVPLEAELSHDLDMPADLELDDLLPAKPSDRPSRS